MFDERLNKTALRDLLDPSFRCPFPGAAERTEWERLPDESRLALRNMARRCAETEYPLLKAGAYMAFVRTGDRGVFEGPYFQRRRKLCAALLGVCADYDLTGLDDVIDGIWLICEESTWVVSAHNGGEHAGVEPPSGAALPDVDRPYVDLFSAQTAMILSLTCHLLSDALDAVSPLIRRRVLGEIETRVLIPFETRDDFWWMGFIRKDLCNWTPWIVSNVLLTACVWVEDPDRRCAIMARGLGMLDRYLDVLPEDGGCDEGPGYWSMAGGALLDCLDLLERATGGRMTFWDDCKLKNVLRFPLNAWLGGEWFINFADCDARPDIPGERLRYAGERLRDPALRALGGRFEMSPEEHLADTPQLWRLLNGLFHTSTGSVQIEPPRDVWLPDLQVRVVRSGGMALAAKGGVNSGSHNHNDCGSFMLYAEDGPLIVDAGNMTYTAATFSDRRFTIWNIRSMYHNVPMIGAMEQVSGPAHRARAVQATPAGISMDLADAYPIPPRKCLRTLALDGACTLRDEISLDRPEAVTEVFMLRRRPEIAGSAVLAGGFRISPAREMAIHTEEIPVEDPRMARSFPGALWRVTFTDAPAEAHDIAFRIERNDP